MVRIPAEEEIKVKWIVGVYYTAFLAVVVYVVVDCVINHRYCLFDAPVAFRSSWVVGQREWGGPHAEPYCLNSSFNWPLPVEHYQFEGPHNLTNVSCAWMDNTAIASFISDNTISIPTFYEVFRSDQVYPDPYFTTALDALVFNVNHGFQHPSVGTVALPETIAYDINGNEFLRFKKDSLVAFSYADILRATGANLDAKTPTLPQLGVADSTFRHTGVYVLMTFSYTNFEANEAAEHILCRVTFTVVNNVWGVIATTNNVEYHGIKMLISGQGSVGYFSTFVLGVYLLNTVVLLGVADFVARQAYMFQDKIRTKCAECADAEVSGDDNDDDVKMQSSENRAAQVATTGAVVATPMHYVVSLDEPATPTTGAAS